MKFNTYAMEDVTFNREIILDIDSENLLSTKFNDMEDAQLALCDFIGKLPYAIDITENNYTIQFSRFRFVLSVKKTTDGMFYVKLDYEI